MFSPGTMIQFFVFVITRTPKFGEIVITNVNLIFNKLMTCWIFGILTLAFENYLPGSEIGTYI